MLGGLGGGEDIDREKAAVTQDVQAAEHSGRQSGAANQVEEAGDVRVTSQFTPAPSAAATASRRGTVRTSPTPPAPTHTRTRTRGQDR